MTFGTNDESANVLFGSTGFARLQRIGIVSVSGR